MPGIKVLQHSLYEAKLKLLPFTSQKYIGEMEI